MAASGKPAEEKKIDPVRLKEVIQEMRNPDRKASVDMNGIRAELLETGPLIQGVKNLVALVEAKPAPEGKPFSSERQAVYGKLQAAAHKLKTDFPKQYDAWLNGEGIPLNDEAIKKQFKLLNDGIKELKKLEAKEPSSPQEKKYLENLEKEIKEVQNEQQIEKEKRQWDAVLKNELFRRHLDYLQRSAHYADKKGVFDPNKLWKRTDKHTDDEANKDDPDFAVAASDWDKQVGKIRGLREKATFEREGSNVSLLLDENGVVYPSSGFFTSEKEKFMDAMEFLVSHRGERDIVAVTKDNKAMNIAQAEAMVEAFKEIQARYPERPLTFNFTGEQMFRLKASDRAAALKIDAEVRKINLVAAKLLQKEAKPDMEMQKEMKVSIEKHEFKEGKEKYDAAVAAELGAPDPGKAEAFVKKLDVLDDRLKKLESARAELIARADDLYGSDAKSAPSDELKTALDALEGKIADEAKELKGIATSADFKAHGSSTPEDKAKFEKIKAKLDEVHPMVEREAEAYKKQQEEAMARPSFKK